MILRCNYFGVCGEPSPESSVGEVIIENLIKTPLIYSLSYFNLRLGVFQGG